MTYFRFNWVQPSSLIERCWCIVHYTPAIIGNVKGKWCFLSDKLSVFFVLNIFPIDFDVLISVWSRLFMIESQGMNEFMLNCPLRMTSSAWKYTQLKPMLLFDHLLEGQQKCVLRHFPKNCWKIDIIGVENLQHFDFHFQEHKWWMPSFILLNYKTQLQAEK